jgi:hypothetical protein
VLAVAGLNVNMKIVGHFDIMSVSDFDIVKREMKYKKYMIIGFTIPKSDEEIISILTQYPRPNATDEMIVIDNRNSKFLPQMVYSNDLIPIMTRLEKLKAFW